MIVTGTSYARNVIVCVAVARSTALPHRRGRAPYLADPPVVADPDVLSGAAELETRRLLHRRDLLGVGRDRTRGTLEVDDRLVVRRRLPRHRLAAEALGRRRAPSRAARASAPCRRARRSRSLRSPPASDRSIFSHLLPAGSCDENAGERMYMTYDPPLPEQHRVDRQGLAADARPHVERDAAARLGAGARHRLPDAAARGRHGHAQRRRPDVGASLHRAHDRARGRLRRDGEREHCDECEGETAHVSQCTDRLADGHPRAQTGRSAGKSTTSLIVSRPVSSITNRSIPKPRPPVGGIP